MKIVITGANGQLGTDLVTLFSSEPNVELFPYGKETLDITDESRVKTIISALQPDLIIHTAAYTAVDDCEKNWKQAFHINSFGTYYVAKVAKDVGAAMIYLSTDFVFNGKKNHPYTVDDIPDPLSMYGASKLLGEQLVQQVVQKSYILRTSWVYGESGQNFVKTMLRLAKKGKEFYVVDDQVGSPTYTKDLAIAIKQLIDKPYGVYHITNEGACSWYTFAQSILTIAGYQIELVKPISTKAYGAIAPRPPFSVLSKESIEKQGISVRHWQFALQEFLKGEEDRDD